MTVATGAVVVGVGMAALAMSILCGVGVVVGLGTHAPTITRQSRRKLLHRRRAGGRAPLPEPVQVEAGELEGLRVAAFVQHPEAAIVQPRQRRVHRRAGVQQARGRPAAAVVAGQPQAQILALAAMGGVDEQQHRGLGRTRQRIRMHADDVGVVARVGQLRFDPGRAVMLAAVFATFLAAGLVKGVTGMGLPTVAMGMLGALISPLVAASLLIVPSFATNVWQLFAGPSFGALLRRLWPMMLAVVVGTLLGSRWIASGDTGVTTLLLGIALIIYSTCPPSAPMAQI